MNKEKFIKLEEMAIAARPINESDWGSDRQIEAQNAFFEFVEEHFPEIMSNEFEAFCLKATSEEMINEAIANVQNVYGPF